MLYDGEWCAFDILPMMKGLFNRLRECSPCPGFAAMAALYPVLQSAPSWWNVSVVAALLDNRYWVAPSKFVFSC